MIDNLALKKYCDDYLMVADFKDYCPNGLQIEGRKTISRIISGVSANQALIEAVIDEGGDALFVHHGFFWKNETAMIAGVKKNRIKALLENDINLFAYHLPLDAHPLVGNNIGLAKQLNIAKPTPIGTTLVWQGEVNLLLLDLSLTIEKALHQTPLVFGEKRRKIKKIAWCTGAAQGYIEHAIEAGADCFISGEVSEQIPAIAKENNIAFIAAGHHATERYGVQLMCEQLAKKFNLSHQFIDIENIV